MASMISTQSEFVGSSFCGGQGRSVVMSRRTDEAREAMDTITVLGQEEIR